MNHAKGKWMGTTIPPTGRDLIFQYHFMPQCLYFTMDLLLKYLFKPSAQYEWTIYENKVTGRMPWTT